jgi:hypothetical protein
MKLLPMFARVRFGRSSSPWPALWLPIGLLWPFVILLLAPLLGVGLLLTSVLEGYSGARFLQLCGGAYALLCESRGTRIDVDGFHTQLSISIR